MAGGATVSICRHLANHPRIGQFLSDGAATASERGWRVLVVPGVVVGVLAITLSAGNGQLLYLLGFRATLEVGKPPIGTAAIAPGSRLRPINDLIGAGRWLDALKLPESLASASDDSAKLTAAFGDAGALLAAYCPPPGFRRRRASTEERSRPHGERVRRSCASPVR